MEITEQIICEWLTSLGNKKAINISLDDVRRLAKMLFKQEHPEVKKL